jgi:hypothetical protein
MAKERKVDGHIDISYTSELELLEFEDRILSQIPSVKVPYRKNQVPWYNEHNNILINIVKDPPEDITAVAVNAAEKLFPRGRFGWTIDLVNPGQTVLEHIDPLPDARKLAPEEKKFVRYVLFLRDRKPGQYIEVNDEPVIDWSMGDYLKLRAEDLIDMDHDWHMATNGGLHPLYVMTISGPVGG